MTWNIATIEGIDFTVDDIPTMVDHVVRLENAGYSVRITDNSTDDITNAGHLIKEGYVDVNTVYEGEDEINELVMVEHMEDV